MMFTRMDERTTEILRRFNESWVATKEFYDKLVLMPGWSHINPVRQFIDELEIAGGKNYYRLGHAVHMLIISRSVDHGLRRGQKFIRIETFGDCSYEVIMGDGEKVYRKYRVNDLRDIRVTKLLKTLESTLVD